MEISLSDLKSLLSGNEKKEVDNKMIGEYVIVRCRDAGVHSGFLESYNGRSCVLTSSRRLWYWKVKEGSGDFLSGVANHGLSDESKIGEEIDRIHLTENCEIIKCSDEAKKSIMRMKSYGR